MLFRDFSRLRRQISTIFAMTLPSPDRRISPKGPGRSALPAHRKSARQFGLWLGRTVATAPSPMRRRPPPRRRSRAGRPGGRSRRSRRGSPAGSRASRDMGWVSSSASSTRGGSAPPSAPALDLGQQQADGPTDHLARYRGARRQQRQIALPQTPGARRPARAQPPDQPSSLDRGRAGRADEVCPITCHGAQFRAQQGATRGRATQSTRRSDHFAMRPTSPRSLPGRGRYRFGRPRKSQSDLWRSAPELLAASKAWLIRSWPLCTGEALRESTRETTPARARFPAGPPACACAGAGAPRIRIP
jgi:hypothetical protein